MGWSRRRPLANVGGSRSYFEALNGSSSSQYAQAGPENAGEYPNPRAQVATAESSGTGRMTGLLARDNSAQLYPSEPYVPAIVNDANRPLAGTLPGIVSLPASAWPDRDTQTDQNVLACVAQNLPGAHLQLPIESNYTNLNLADNWAAWAGDIGQSAFYQTMTSDSACGPFTQAEAETVIKQPRSTSHPTGCLSSGPYATSDDTFVQSHGASGQFPSAGLLSQLFDAPQNDPVQTGSLFNPLQFAVETYDDGTTNTETVTHAYQSVANSSGGGASTNLICRAS